VAESWLANYLEYTQKHEAPEIFHKWIGLSILGAALGRKVWFNKGYYNLYPNLFVVLVAGSARCRKTTAIEIGARLLEGIECVDVVLGKTTTEKFLADMEHKGSGPPPATFIKADELSVFLTQDQQGVKLIDVLTKLFDCPERFVYKTVLRGEVVLGDVFVSILAGTTPASIGRVLPDAAFGGGFASRILFVYQEDTNRRNALPELSRREVDLRHRLQTNLESISNRSGQFRFDNASTRQFYTDWYNGLPRSDDERIDGFTGRKGDHVLRVAIIVEASGGASSSISRESITESINLIQELEALMPGAFRDVGMKMDKKDSDRIMRQLHKAGSQGFQHSILLRKQYGHLNGKEFREMMASLLESGFVQTKKDDDKVYICRCEVCVR